MPETVAIDPLRRESVRDDLSEFVRGDLIFDDIYCSLYAGDASIFQIEPLGVVAPADEDDLCAVVRYCHEQKLSVTPRGAGTGLAGESLNDGVIVDLSRHFRQIVEVGADFVRVQPGVVLQHLNAELARQGRRFAPDPASGATCTIGGMIATDASGSRCIKHGFTRDYIRRARIVLDNGDAVTVGEEPVDASHGTRIQQVVSDTAKLIAENADVILAQQPLTRFNRCGYRLDGVLNEGRLNVPRLLAGSEGTLALVTEAELATIPLPGGQAALLLGFGSLEKALRAVRLVLGAGPSACELLDRRLISLARTSMPEAPRYLPPTLEAVLLVEFEADHATDAKRTAEAVVRQVHDKGRLSIVAEVAGDRRQMDLFWRLRDSALPNLFGLGHGSKPIPFIEDIGVPPDRLAEFLTRVQTVLQQHETTGSFLTHAATGQVHIRPFLDLRQERDLGRMRPLAHDVYSLVLEMGGTISAQHGVGLARTPWVPRQFGPLYRVFAGIKAVFDPDHILNPGKIVGSPTTWPEWPIRPATVFAEMDRALAEKQRDNQGDPTEQAAPETPTLALALNWEKDEVARQMATCNGCGHCRIQSPAMRMCPIFHIDRAEAATPRAKVNLLRRVLADPDPKRLAEDDVRTVADLCVNCRMCALECPAHVNVPKLMLEAKAAHRAEHGLERADWFLSRIELWASLGSRLSSLVNPLLETRSARWVMERLFGISRQRSFPPFSPRSFLRRDIRRRQRESPPAAAGVARVAYFVDVFANTNDPLVAESAVAVLEHNGVIVHVPRGQWSSGMALLAMGDVETARDLAESNLRVLAPLARDGWRIVCTEPSAALMLSRDYLDLVHGPEAQVVAAQTVEICQLLAELHDAGKLRTDFRPLDAGIGCHVPCHVKALGGGDAASRLLRLIPKVRAHTIDVSCSGMAGTYGMKRKHYWSSLEAGRPMIEELRRPRVMFGAAECSACRMQMEEGSGKRAMHPVQYLALAYGLLPELEKRLRTPLADRLVP